MAKILIVDDDTESTTMLSALVRSMGHEPASENASWNAIQTARLVNPDLILMDIMMAEINGIELTRMLKQDPALAHIPVVMVSALSDEGSRKDSFNAGAVDFITKPIYAKEFTQRINAVLGG